LGIWMHNYTFWRFQFVNITFDLQKNQIFLFIFTRRRRLMSN
jgi:hypothetical protein